MERGNPLDSWTLLNLHFWFPSESVEISVRAGVARRRIGEFAGFHWRV